MSQIKGQITQAQYQAGSTSNLAAAIKSARENFFTASKGDRHGVQNFLIVLTNGASNVPAAVAEVGWVDEWFVGWLNGRVFGWMVGCLADWFGWVVSLLVCWVVGWLVCWLDGCVFGWMDGWLADWFGWLVGWFGWLGGWMVGWFDDSLHG